MILQLKDDPSGPFDKEMEKEIPQSIAEVHDISITLDNNENSTKHLQH